MNDSANLSTARPRHRWPWILAALLIVGVLLAVLAVRNEARRVEELREFQIPNSAR